MLVTPEDLKLAVDLYKDSNSSVMSLWTIYSAAAFALVGYLLGSEKPIPVRAIIGLGLIFLAFAIANAVSLCRAQRTGYAAACAIKEIRQTQNSDVPAVLQKSLSTLTMSSPVLVVGFQVSLSVCALAAVVATYIHDTHAAK